MPERNELEEMISIMAQRPKRKPDPNKTKHAQKSKPTQPEAAALQPTSDTSGTLVQDVKPPKPGAVAGDSGLRARPLVEATYGLTEAGITHGAGEFSLLQDRIIRHLQYYHPIRRTMAQIAFELSVDEQIVVSVLQDLSRTYEAPGPPEVRPSATRAGAYRGEADLGILGGALPPLEITAVVAPEQEAQPAPRVFGLTPAGCAAARNGNFDRLGPDDIRVVQVLLAAASQPCSGRLQLHQIIDESKLSAEPSQSACRVRDAIQNLLNYHWVE